MAILTPEQKQLLCTVAISLGLSPDALAAQIAAAEQEIDRLVYGLFGLTPDEIALLESSIAGQA